MVPSSRRRAPSERLVIDDQQVELRRSARRRRTVSAYRDGDVTVVLLPARLSAAEERQWAQDMLSRLATRSSRGVRGGGDAELRARAMRLSRAHLDGRPRPASVRWVDNQTTRWGSCTPADGTIRLSARLRTMPAWVIDYVLVHELVHLHEPGHGPAFWGQVARYPRAERAMGYLEGVAGAAGLDLAGLTDGALPAPPDDRVRRPGWTVPAPRRRAAQDIDQGELFSG